MLSPYLNEKQVRLLVAAESIVVGPYSAPLVAKVVGLSRHTVRAGIAELERPESIEPTGVRHRGAGPKFREATDGTLRADLETLIAPTTRGDPESPLRWTCKSAAKLAEELRAKGHRVGATTVRRLLHAMGYGLQANRKTREGTQDHPGRDAQFQHIHDTVQGYQRRGQPVISVVWVCT